MASTEPTVWEDADAELVPAIGEAEGGGEVAELVGASCRPSITAGRETAATPAGLH